MDEFRADGNRVCFRGSYAAIADITELIPPMAGLY
jgi:hypothetical protein